VILPDVVAGQAGWPPPPHKNIMTPPATFVGAKCRWATERGDDRSEKDSEKLMLLSTICIWNSAEPAVLIGGTSFSPTRFAEKSSVAERAALTAKRLAVSVVIAQMAILLVFMVCSCRGYV
jgi:hypothetical protein